MKLSYLVCAAALVFPNTLVHAQNSTKNSKSSALKTAPGVVVRKAPPPRLDVLALGSFTPSFMDSNQIGRVGIPVGFAKSPSLSDSLLGTGGESSFTFTPSGRSPDRGDFSLGLSGRTRETSRIVPTSSSTGSGSTGQALSQNVAVTVGYAGFALEAGFSRMSRANKPLAQGMDLGVSYKGKDWKTGLTVSEDATEVDIFGLPGVYTPESSRAVEFGAAYELTSWLAINGGLRYEIFSPRTFLGNTRSAALDARAIYLGTQVKF
jgi:hypothetical protein